MKKKNTRIEREKRERRDEGKELGAPSMMVRASVGIACESP